MSFVNLNITIIHSLPLGLADFAFRFPSPPPFRLSVSFCTLILVHFLPLHLSSFPSPPPRLLLASRSSSSNPRGCSSRLSRFLDTTRGAFCLFCFQRPSRMRRTALKFQISFNGGIEVQGAQGVWLASSTTMQLGSR